MRIEKNKGKKITILEKETQWHRRIFKTMKLLNILLFTKVAAQ